MKIPINEWNLNSIFSNKNNYQEFRQFLNTLDSDLHFFCEQLDYLESPRDILPSNIQSLFKKLQDIIERLGLANGYLVCLQTDQVNVIKYKKIVTRLLSSYFTASFFVDYYIGKIPEENWSIIISDELVYPISFSLEKRRYNSRSFTSPTVIRIINSLTPIGLHSWEELHSTLLKKVEIETQRKIKHFSNIKTNEFNMHENIRKQEFEIRNKTLFENQDLFASILNNLSGFRLAIYEVLNKDSFLTEALFDINNMSETSLWKMWEVIELNKDKLHKYLKIKAEILGKDRLSWEDLNAPILKSDNTVEHSQSVDLIIDGLSSFSTDFKEFIHTFFQESWIKSENDPTKKRCAFSLNFANKKQSRVYINVPNDLSYTTTLAHELGHAYHYHVLYDLPILSQNYSLSMAETASALTELIVTDSIINEQSSVKNILSYMNLKMENNVVFLLDIYSRFLFEYELYQNRQHGVLNSERLNELMEHSQKKAFGNMIENYNPSSWCSKNHYYKTMVPFYNFPYAFGCLFSNFLLSRFKQNSTDFVKNFEQLLKDTGSMTIENLILKHFNLNLQENYFWQEAMDCIINDLEKFEETVNTHRD
ncbi:hypothetical protein ACOI1C_14690 [Bacillus sp. DJP31]|uniref:hypothetical protein n=1 Tax=Bacillus sp. DJP31 TaxID=3409789 RepID=UPI003BB5663B